MSEADPPLAEGAAAVEQPPQRNEDLSREVKTVPWSRQFAVVFRKNYILLWRRPIMLMTMFLSSAAAVSLTLAAAPNVDFDEVPLTECGTPDSNYYRNLQDSGEWNKSYNIPLSYNQSWMNGIAVTCLALGPMIHAISCFLLVHSEFQSQMLGVLRGLGLRESVFWLSWYATFSLTSLVNSLIGAGVASIIPLHVFDNTYFAGVFAGLFSLNIALVACSFFLAALLSTSRHGVSWFVLIMLVAPWIPQIVLTSKAGAFVPTGASIVSEYSDLTSPVGLFWVNGNTTISQIFYEPFDFTDNFTQGFTTSSCELPVLSEEEGNDFKTDAERQQVSEDEWFVGCYAAAGFSSTLWSNPRSYFPLYFVPYTHFAVFWANVLGYTGMPNRKFTHEQMTMSPEALAVASLLVPPNESNSKGTTLFPQGSTVHLEQKEYTGDRRDFFSLHNSYPYNCPASKLTDYFCESVDYDNCGSSRESTPLQQDSPSALHAVVYLILLSFFYGLVAAYWAEVFPGANGAPRPLWFWLLPSYWVGSTKASVRIDAAGIVVTEVSKKYGGVEALKQVSLKMESGEVTALLGHNGAGKTTLSHILCCEIAPSEGHISIYGHSVTKDPYTVRQLVGVCKQDDYLYPRLNAKEHLELFAGLRGVPSAAVATTVQEWLESVDLATVQSQFSAGFSGGMKRRLSVALSTIGDRPLIILDEPTTGMDPVSRRHVWRHIDSIKKGRVILLTTHAMEEADLLSDVVAVMRKGQVAACGTPLELKADYGTALQFSLVVPPEHVETTRYATLDHFADSQEWIDVDAGEAGNIAVNIKQVRQDDTKSSGVGVNQLADFVAWLEGDESEVNEYGFSNSSLEDVFLKITEGDDDEKLDHDVDKGGCCCCSKRTTRNDNTDAELGGEEDEDVEIPDGKLSAMSSYKPDLTVRRQVVSLVRNSFARGWTGKGSIWGWSFYAMLFLVGNALLGIYASSFYDQNPAFTYQTVAVSLVLINVARPVYADRKTGLFYLMRTQGLLKHSYVLGHGLYAWWLSFVVSLVTLSVLYATPLFRDPTIRGEYSWGKWSFGDPPYDDYPLQINWWIDEFEGQPVRLYVSRGPGGYALLFGVASVFSLTMPGALFASSHLPGHKLPLVLVSFITLAAGIVPLFSYFFNYPDTLEEQLQCERSVCDTNTIEFNITTVDSVGRDFLNCAGLDAHSYDDTIGALCSTPVSSILPQYGFFQGLTSSFMARLIFTSDPPGYVENVLMPAIGGNVKCSGTSCTFPRALELYIQQMGWMILGGFILLMIGYAQVSMFVFPSTTALKVKHIISSMMQPFRRKEFYTRATEFVDEPRLEEVTEEEKLVASIIKPLLQEVNGTLEIADHTSLGRNDLPPVLAYKLGKIYPSLGGLPPKVALESLNLHVPKGQVLGLLGKNGAGKTTALKILSMAHEASGGVALVAGYDVSSEQLGVFERLGNCPQFDKVWATSSVQYHLEFFARLKGLPLDKVKTIALSMATAVGLGAPDVYKRNAGALSGGMRRRLSIAISLIGAPTVLLLDEPSTGLDPSTRNSIWKLVNSFSTEERAVIITTHMMVEADVLCNRIAIVSDGRLKVVATQQRLKDRFGSGYLLQLNLDKSTEVNQAKAMAFVRERLHKDAVLQAKQAKTLQISLPRDLNLTGVFRALYSSESATEGHINQFLLSQSSLEDVFIALSEEYTMFAEAKEYIIDDEEEEQDYEGGDDDDDDNKEGDGEEEFAV